MSRTTATCSQASRPSGMTAPIARFHGHTASAAGLSAQSTKSVQGNQRCGWLRVSPRIESGGRLMLSRTNPGHRGTSGVLCAAFLGQRWSCNVQRPPGCNARMVGGAGLRKERGPKSKAASGLPGETPKGCGRKLPYGSARSPAGSWNTGGRLIALTHRTHEMLRVDEPVRPLRQVRLCGGLWEATACRQSPFVPAEISRRDGRMSVHLPSRGGVRAAREVRNVVPRDLRWVLAALNGEPGIVGPSKRAAARRTSPVANVVAVVLACETRCQPSDPS